MCPVSVAREVWGILGGMGPLSSAEFLRTIYERTSGAKEQDSPVIYLISDPTIPDRTDCLARASRQLLVTPLAKHLDRLLALGASRVVVCCVTIHAVFPQLSPEIRSKLVSLLDVIFDVVRDTDAQHLLIATNGARQQQIFERHPFWSSTKDRIVLPSEIDQQAVHELLYRIKMNRYCCGDLAFIESLLMRYGVSSYIVGCTEGHILAKEHRRRSLGVEGASCIDPLTQLVSMIWQDCRAVSNTAELNNA